jgi:LPXTG-site transpeptidase (sortase) family protein
MGTPKGPFDVAWFNLGPRPGEVGSAVIAGHYGRWKNGSGSVFDNLNRLKKGDKIYIEDKKGSIVTFVVRESKIYNPNANAADVFYSMDGKAHLNLITCEGIWDNVRKTYSNRLIVFTDKE